MFCFDDGLLAGRHASGNRTRFLLECLADLDQALRDRGGALYVRHGRPERELRALAADLGATEVHYSRDVGPFSRQRLESVREALAQDEVELVGHPGLFTIDALDPIRTGAGKPYTVFTPFFKNWTGQPRREVIGAPREIPRPGLARGQRPASLAGRPRPRGRGL